MPRERLSPSQMERYQAHLALPDFGPGAQQRLLDASVAIVGIGGLGCPAALYLAAGGLGSLTLLDDDIVDRTNLQRQVLYAESDVGRPKAVAAAERLAAVNSDVRVNALSQRVTATNARELLRGHDVVIDGSDNFATRYVVNDTCVLEGMPLVSGSMYRYEGQVLVVVPGRTACYRCLFPAGPAEQAPCYDAGLLGALGGIIGSLQAAETMKLIGHGSTALAGRLLLVDAQQAVTRRIECSRDPRCAVCGEAPQIDQPTAVANPCEGRSG